MARLLTVFVVGLVLVAADATAVPVAPPPREVAPYYPSTVGDKLVHAQMRRGQEIREWTELVTGVETGANGTVVVSTGIIGTDGKTYRHVKVELSDRGVFMTEDWSGPPYSHPWPLLKLPHREGQTWGRPDNTATVGGVFMTKDRPDNTATLWMADWVSAHGPERVKVPAGVFDCIRVEYRESQSHNPWQTEWYARGVGRVRRAVDDTHIVLKSFTPGKDVAP
jgi:hypothetical protein